MSDTPNLSPGAREVLLAFADDEHLMGQHYTEWIGVTPFLEEDLAFSSIGQDELGHAAMLYALLVGDDDQAIDRLALGRRGDDYRSCWFTERPTEDWAEAIVRHWLYDRAEELRWESLASSSVPEVAAVAARAAREETYHRRHGDGVLDVLLADPDARPRLLAALSAWVPLAAGFFEPVAGEAEALADGVQTVPLADLRRRWEDSVAERFGPVAWGDGPAQVARTTRSEWFDPLMTRMQEVIALDPDAVW